MNVPIDFVGFKPLPGPSWVPKIRIVAPVEERGKCACGTKTRRRARSGQHYECARCALLAERVKQWLKEDRGTKYSHKEVGPQINTD